MRFYEVEPACYKISIHYGHKWGLPGVHCPTCDASWGTAGASWPCVDLSGHPDAKKLSKAYLEEDFGEFVRLREAVRPWVPKEADLKPGTEFGPAVGPARGTAFGPLTMGYAWMMLARPEGVQFLESEELQGIKAGPTAFKFRGTPQEILELQIEPHGRLHPDCLPPDRAPPCPTCGRSNKGPLPDSRILELATMPADRDLFRLSDFGVIVVTERFVEAVKRLGCEDLAFVELSGR